MNILLGDCNYYLCRHYCSNSRAVFISETAGVKYLLELLYFVADSDKELYLSSVISGVWKLPDLVCHLVDNSSLDFSR